jgi:Rrf2 family transcriptional regulator, nitric oxide-sensitive transcriptional repressor
VRLTSFTDYALRLLLHVASAPEGRSTIADAARQCGASEHHMVKIAHTLGQLGFLANTRGRRGGLRLAGPPIEINLGALVRSIERTELAECFDPATNTCPFAGGCRLEGALHQAARAFHEVLDRYSLADLARPVPANGAQVIKLS